LGACFNPHLVDEGLTRAIAVYDPCVLVYLLRTSLCDVLTLSLDGRQLIRAMGTRVHKTEAPSFDAIVMSAAPAAIQTAELFAERVDFLGCPEILPALDPGVPSEIAGKLILARGATVLVVADEPALSALGAFLIGRPTFPPLGHAQVSVIEDRKPAFCLRPGESARSLLLVY
jgi:phosphohistidine phosphatase SixA